MQWDSLNCQILLERYTGEQSTGKCSFLFCCLEINIVVLYKVDKLENIGLSSL